jgi:hypothetical protein
VTWAVEQRVARAPGDTEKDHPQLLHKAMWVWLCTRWTKFRGKDARAWCGERHQSAEAAQGHAEALNMGEVKHA